MIGFSTRIFWGLLVISLAATIGIEFILINNKGLIENNSIRCLYLILFFGAPLIILLNSVVPIFYKKVVNKAWSPGSIIFFAAIDIIVFVGLLIYGFVAIAGFDEIYAKKILVLQVVNVIYLWAIICGLIGQENFSPFWRDFMRRPASTLGYLVTKYLIDSSGKNRGGK